jgi:hypothetical protein
MAFTPSVSWTGGSSATGFNATPEGKDDPRQGDDRIRELKLALSERLSREWYFALKGSSSAGQEGNARQGAGRVYHTSSAPTTKPDGNALDSDDVGRLYCYSNVTNLYVRSSAAAWVAVKVSKADYAAVATLTSKTNFVLETGASGVTMVKKITIGDWNMDSTASVAVAHGLTFSKIIAAGVLIRNDATNLWKPLNDAGGFTIDTTNFNLTRTTSGYFDSIDYDATGYDRGVITVWYVQ